MNEVHHVAIRLTKVQCDHDSAENGQDDIFFKTKPNGGGTTTHYDNSPIKIETGVDRAVDIDLVSGSLCPVQLSQCDQSLISSQRLKLLASHQLIYPP